MEITSLLGLILLISTAGARTFSWEPSGRGAWRESSRSQPQSSWSNDNSQQQQQQSWSNDNSQQQSWSNDNAPQQQQQPSWSNDNSQQQSWSNDNSQQQSWSNDNAPQQQQQQSWSQSSSSSWSDGDSQPSQGTQMVWMSAQPAPAPAPSYQPAPAPASKPTQAPPVVMPSGACEWPGQYLAVSGDRCSYMQCDIGGQPSQDGNYRLSAKMRMCAPGTGTPEDYEGGTDNPCTARPAECLPRASGSNGQSQPSWTISPAPASSEDDKDVVMMVVMSKGDQSAPWSSNPMPSMPAPAPAPWSAQTAPSPAPWAPAPAQPMVMVPAPAPWSGQPAPSSQDGGKMMVVVWANDDDNSAPQPQQPTPAPWSSSNNGNSYGTGSAPSPAMSSWQPEQQTSAESNPKVMSFMQKMMQKMVTIMNTNKNDY